MSEAGVVEVALDAMLGKETIYTAKRGQRVRVHDLELGGALRILATMKKVGVVAIPPSLSVADFVTPDQRLRFNEAKSPVEKLALLKEFTDELTFEQKQEIRRAGEKQFDAMLEWACASEVLLPVILEAVTDLKRDEIVKLKPSDALNILGEAVQLIDWPEVFEAAQSFFSRIGGLMQAAGRQSAGR